MGKLALRHNSLRSVSAASLLVKRPSPPLHSNCILYIFDSSFLYFHTVLYFILFSTSKTKKKYFKNFAISGNNWCTQLQINKVVINVKLVFRVPCTVAQVAANIWQRDFITTGKVENARATRQLPNLEFYFFSDLRTWDLRYLRNRYTFLPSHTDESSKLRFVPEWMHSRIFYRYNFHFLTFEQTLVWVVRSTVFSAPRANFAGMICKASLKVFDGKKTSTQKQPLLTI